MLDEKISGCKRSSGRRARRIGADGYAADASQAVALAKSLI